MIETDRWTIRCAEVDEARAIEARLATPLADVVAAHIDICARCAGQEEQDAWSSDVPNELVRLAQRPDWDSAALEDARVVAAMPQAQRRVGLITLLRQRAGAAVPVEGWLDLAVDLLAGDSDEVARQAAVDVVAALSLTQGAPEGLVLDTLLSALEGDPSGGVRIHAARALAAIGPDTPAVIDVLIAACRGTESDTFVREAAVDTLSSVMPHLDDVVAPIARAALIDAAGDGQSIVRRAVAHALGASAPSGVERSRVVAALGRLVADRDWGVRQDAGWALTDLVPGPDDRAVRALLQAGLHDPEPGVRTAVAAAVAAADQAGGDDTLADLAALLTADHADAAVRQGVFDALRPEILQRPDSIPVRRVLRAVERALDDDDPDVRAAAIAVAARRGRLWNRVRERLEAIAQDPAAHRRVREAALAAREGISDAVGPRVTTQAAGDAEYELIGLWQGDEVAQGTARLYLEDGQRLLLRLGAADGQSGGRRWVVDARDSAAREGDDGPIEWAAAPPVFEAMVAAPPRETTVRLGRLRDTAAGARASVKDALDALRIAQEDTFEEEQGQ